MKRLAGDLRTELPSHVAELSSDFFLLKIEERLHARRERGLVAHDDLPDLVLQRGLFGDHEGYSFTCAESLAQGDFQHMMSTPSPLSWCGQLEYK